MKTSFGLVLIALLLATGNVVAQDSLGMRRISTLEYWNSVYDIQMVGDLAYIVRGPCDLEIMSLVDPTNPVQIGHANWDSVGGCGGGIYVTDDIAYIASGCGLVIYDVSDPTHPEFIQHWGWKMNDLIVRDGIGYANVGEGYPIILDLRDFDNINDIGHFQGNLNSPEMIALDGNFLFTAGYGGVQIWDVSDPSLPLSVAGIDTNFHVRGAVKSGDYMYVSTFFEDLRIIDVSDPYNPVDIGALDESNCNIMVHDDYLYVSHYTHLNIWDISDPHHPAGVSGFSFNLYFPLNITANEQDIVCVGIEDGHSSVMTLDLSDPTTPVIASSFGHAGYLTCLTIDEDVIYPGSYGGLHTVDFSNPYQIDEIGVSDSEFGIDAVAVEIRGSYAYTVTRYYGIVIYDISDPEHPDSVSCIQIRPFESFDPEAFVIAGDYLYACDDRLRTFSLQNPIEPVQTDTLNEEVMHLAAGNGYLYGSRGTEMIIFSLENPAAPQEVRTVGSYYIHDIEVEGDLCFTARGGHGAAIYSIENPAQPDYIRIIAGTFTRLAAEDHVLFTYGSDTIRVFDVSDLLNPEEVGYYVVQKPLAQMEAVDSYLLTVTFDELRVYEVDALSGVHPQPSFLPQTLTLYPSYPNPFNPEATIRFELPVASDVSLTVYNALGQQVEMLASGVMNPGSHVVTFDGSRFSSGSYFYTLKAGSFVETRKMVLVK